MKKKLEINMFKQIIETLFYTFSGSPWTGRGAAPLPPDKNSRDIEFLDKYALERWEVGFCSYYNITWCIWKVRSMTS